MALDDINFDTYKQRIDNKKTELETALASENDKLNEVLKEIFEITGENDPGIIQRKEELQTKYRQDLEQTTKDILKEAEDLKNTEQQKYEDTQKKYEQVMGQGKRSKIVDEKIKNLDDKYSAFVAQFQQTEKK